MFGFFNNFDVSVAWVLKLTHNVEGMFHMSLKESLMRMFYHIGVQYVQKTNLFQENL
jgi:hypothetical protein